MKARDRPKGSTQTVIGLSRKHASKNTNHKKPMKFWCKRPSDKDRGTNMNIYYQYFYLLLRYAFMVCGLAHAAKSALTGRILTEKNVKVNPASVSTACLDENVSMHRIKHYFSSEGWKTVLSIWEKVVGLGWRCGICKKELDGDQIGCDGYFLWYHYRCVGYKKTPKCLT